GALMHFDMAPKVNACLAAVRSHGSQVALKGFHIHNHARGGEVFLQEVAKIAARNALLQVLYCPGFFARCGRSGRKGAKKNPSCLSHHNSFNPNWMFRIGAIRLVIEPGPLEMFACDGQVTCPEEFRTG